MEKTIERLHSIIQLVELDINESKKAINLLSKKTGSESLIAIYNEDIKDYLAQIEETRLAINILSEHKQCPETNKERGFPISKVVFFELKNGKYLTSDGTEITTDFIINYAHSIFHDNGYLILDKQ